MANHPGVYNLGGLGHLVGMDANAVAPPLPNWWHGRWWRDTYWATSWWAGTLLALTTDMPGVWGLYARGAMVGVVFTPPDAASTNVCLRRRRRGKSRRPEEWPVKR